MFSQLNNVGGVMLNGVPTIGGYGHLPASTGSYFFVSSVVGSNGNNGKSPSTPLATLAQAQAYATAAKGDVVVLMPGHAETLTAVLALSKSGLTVVGLGAGTLKPTFTVNAAADGLSLTGASVSVHNIHFAAPETDEATAMINIAAAGCSISNITGIGSKTAKNFVDCITIASGADDLTINGLHISNTTVAVNSFISIEAAVARLRLENVDCFGDVATAGLIDAATATQIVLKDVNIGVVGTTKPAATLDSNPTGIAVRCNFAGTHGTLATNAALGTGLRLFDVKVLEETGGAAQGALIPAVDAE
jgi:hypothetical protein